MNPDHDAYQQAASHYSNARYDDALIALAPMLARTPAHVEALDLAAVCCYQLNRMEEAEACWRRAIAEHPHEAGPYNNLGNALNASGRLDEAKTAYGEAIARRPDFTEAQYNLANVLHALGHRDEAERSFRRALQLNPRLADAHYNLARLLADNGRAAEAQAAYRDALIARPGYAEAHNNLGNLLKDAGRLDEAVGELRAAVADRPDWPDAHFNLGNALRAQDRLADAERAYRDALALRPSFGDALINLGSVLTTLGRFDEAEAAYRRAIAANPDRAEAHCNLGRVIHEQAALGRWARLPEAERAYRDALSRDPGLAAALNNLGNLIGEDGARAEQAEALYRAALRADPEFGAAKQNLAATLLRAGKLSEGWQWYESRFDDDTSARPLDPSVFGCPQWRGEALAGKSLVVVAEQGFGDSIQFCRYLPMLASRGASALTVVCPPALVSLLASVDGLTRCVPFDAAATLPPHEFWCFVMSLPARFETTLDSIPSATPYVHAQAARIGYWGNRLPARRFKVGVVWSGEPRPWVADSFGAFSRRWLDARLCAPLLDTPGVAFVSLHKGATARAQLAALPERLRPLDPMDEVADFADTAAIVASLDLVISVDTSVAHLAGALGKPVWVLLHSNADWRWLDARDDSPWYPTARLFRQASPGDWTEVIARVADELRATLRFP
ncbi:tetratricopeptide repeat protein [Caballeronia sp. Lep1P3]|uniref:tetratricopeptide repeat protein n=1 Tax=Caballeronia sp. Lep1P3 TaxID=2878150 RepID=UPI001FD4BE75|nr:tetratricopeptide repeat protein [Caballeronia sp. Lep1P3]